MAATGNSCQFLKIFLSETALPKGTDIWWEAPMEIGQSETRIAFGSHVC
jgi:hypothetical protein